MKLPCPSHQDVVIIGATGDLARRKLIPALYNLLRAGLLPPEASILGLARRDIGRDGFRELARRSITEHSRTGLDESVWERFAARLQFTGLAAGYERLAAECRASSRLVYLATPPESMPEIVRGLGAHGLARGARLIVEKPFGADLASSRTLNRIVHEVFDEADVYRIDHYLGKETVQNILVFRFANSIFERVWHRDAIDHIRITIAESIGIEGRGAFYEQTGALRDILQNHALQMLALLTMEPPSRLDARALRDEKTKLLQAVRPVNPAHAVRGQYAAGSADGRPVPAYREEPGVRPDSEVETFVALRLEIDNWRWAGVPVHIRTGKRLPQRVTNLEVAFKPAPSALFEPAGVERLHPNHLAHQIQPEESIQLRFLAKAPGPEMRLQPVSMEFSYDGAFMVEPAEAYERLLYDAMQGDPMLFVREDAIDRSWEIVQPLLDAPPSLHFYPAGTWGPEAAPARSRT